MGMYYSFGTSWGVPGTFEDGLPSGLEDMDEDDLYSEPEIATGVKLYIGHNEAIGDRTWRLIVEESEVGCDGRGEDYPNGFLPPFVLLSEPSAAVKVNFGLALEKLGIVGRVPGWFFHWSVS